MDTRVSASKRPIAVALPPPGAPLAARGLALKPIVLGGAVIAFALGTMGLIKVDPITECRSAPLAFRPGIQAQTAISVANGMACAVFVRAGFASLKDLSIETAPAHGSLVLRGRTGVTYRPAKGYSGVDTFSFALKTAADSKDGTMTVQVRVAVR